MPPQALDPFMGAEDSGTSHRNCDSSLNTPPAALPPHEVSRYNSFLSCETSDEETTHDDRQKQSEIDPALGRQQPYHDTSDPRSSVTPHAWTTTQITECGQQPPAANSGDCIEDNGPSEVLPRPEQSNEEAILSVRHSLPLHSTYIIDIHILTARYILQASPAHSGKPVQSKGVGPEDNIPRSDGSTSDYDSVDLGSQLIKHSKGCVFGQRDVYNKLFVLVKEEFQYAQMLPDTIASRLSQNIINFYQKWARPLNKQLNLPDDSGVWKIIMPILKNDSYDSDFKIKEVVENVDKLYGGSGWVLIQELAAHISADDSGYFDIAGSTPISTPTPKTRKSIENHLSPTPIPQYKHMMTKGEDGETISTPPPKRRRTGADPSSLLVTSCAKPESQSSPFQGISCREQGCTCSTNQNNMKRHYQDIHCPPKVWICPHKSGGEPCCYWSSRKSNVSNHFITKHKMMEEEKAKATEKLDKNSLQPPDFGHRICPFCLKGEDEPFADSEGCLDHMMDHYKDGSSKYLTFHDRRHSKHDEKSVRSIIGSIVRNKFGRKQPKPTGAPPSNDQDDVNDDDSDQGGPPHGGSPNAHDRHTSNPGGNSHDNQGRGGGSNSGIREGDAAPEPSGGRHRGRSQCHVKTKPSDVIAASISPNKSGSSWPTYKTVSSFLIVDASDRGDRWSCLTYVSELGRGGFGVVDEVRCESTNQTYARKVVLSPHSPSSVTSSEARILERLHHSHIIKLVDTWKSQLGLWLLMSPVAKSDLAVYLHRAGSEPHTVSSPNKPEKQPLRNWVGCLSSALAYLHENGVVHGDIKPKNILISSDQIVYVSDFGTAEYVEEVSKTTPHRFSALTPMYCAPEISNHQVAVFDYPADVFSLGCVWAEMATVYAGKSVQEFEKFRRLDSPDAAFHATIPRSLMWIDSLPIPRGLYDGCAHEFLKAVKNMLSFDPRNRPTMKDLITHFRCSCSTWPLSSSQAPIAIHNQCHGPANETLLSTSLQPLYGFPSWLRSYSEAVPSRYTSGNHMADENKLVGPWKFNRTYKTEDCQQLPHLRENAMFLEKRLELGLLWIKSDAGFGDIPLMGRPKPPETFVCLKMGEGDERLFGSETAVIKSCTARTSTRTIGSYRYFQQDRIQNLYSLEDYFRNIPPPTTTQNISKLWRNVLGLAVALKFLQKCLHKKPPKFRSDLFLKPANILISETKGDSPYSWRFGISDFGVSQLDAMKTEMEIGETYIEKTHDYRDDYPTEYDPRRCSQSGESTTLAASLGCIYLEFATWIVDPKVKPNGRSRSCTPGSNRFSNVQDTRKSRAYEELMPSHTHSPWKFKEYLSNLGEFSDPITKAVSNDLISELLEVTSDKMSLERLLQKADLMRQDWSQNFVGAAKKRSNLSINKKTPSVWSTTTRHRHSSTAPIDTETSSKLSNEQGDLEYVMDCETDLEIGPNSSPRTSSIDQGMKHYLRDRPGLESWLRDGVDFKSFSVIEYDPFQTARRELHEQLIMNTVNCFSNRVSPCETPSLNVK
ncbi:hypothetical protein B0O99DRAFT_684446 [Bisporella sp. PMI_857]|nr:hypothetical protein B0O99DRAFT_684446 [Bisporella sp. PMI_857]